MKLISIHGHTDGLRWGDLRLGNHRRRFHLDLLSGGLRLYDMRVAEKRGEEYAEEDQDPDHLAEAMGVLSRIVGSAAA